MLLRVAIIVMAYLIGSIPTALIFSSSFHGRDIRTVGDGNMGAHNVQREYGFKSGFLVAIIDMAKGTIAVLLAMILQFPLNWQLAAGAAAILGHDFSIFAQFRGGQGLAITAGVFFALFPKFALIGTVIYGLIYLVFRNSNIAASVCMGTYALMVYFAKEPLIIVVFIITVLVFIPVKRLMDKPRRRRILSEVPINKNNGKED